MNNLTNDKKIPAVNYNFSQIKNINKLIIILTLAVTISAQPGTEAVESIYYSLNDIVEKTYIWDSDFGEIVTTIEKTDSSYNYVSEGDGFYYAQEYIERDDSIFTIETKQRFKVLLVISKSAEIIYNKPMLRYPKLISAGDEWTWQGIEYFEEKGDTVVSHITGKVIRIDTLVTPAGTFNTLVVETKFTNANGSENIITEWITENSGVVQSKITVNGGGMLGFLAGVLGYGEINFTLKEIKL